jgi:hypothetical protein
MFLIFSLKYFQLWRQIRGDIRIPNQFSSVNEQLGQTLSSGLSNIDLIYLGYVPLLTCEGRRSLKLFDFPLRCKDMQSLAHGCVNYEMTQRIDRQNLGCILQYGTRGKFKFIGI